MVLRVMLFVRGSRPWAGWTIMVWAGKVPKWPVGRVTVQKCRYRQNSKSPGLTLGMRVMRVSDKSSK